MTSTETPEFLTFRQNPPSPIRDTIHNYIRTTRLEAHVIDSPEFQRLRDILQNSTAYLTYPCNTNTRFAHSLGVMHIAGKMFITALKNANKEVLFAFLKDASSLIAHCGEQDIDNEGETYGEVDEKADFVATHQKEWKNLLGNISRFSHNPELFDAADLSEYDDVFDPYFIVNTLWQAVRLGALTHDIGHLCMSHVFESAINDAQRASRDRREEEGKTVFESSMEAKEHQFKKKVDQKFPELIGHAFRDVYSNETTIDVDRKFHENLGLAIFCSMYGGKKYKPYPELIKKLTTQVLATPPHSICVQDDAAPEQEGESDRLSFLSFLHSIFDNDFIDADRLDYCLRDPQSSGSELGAFDSKRVIDSCTLVKHEEGVYRLAHNYKSIGAIESFFFQRHSAYTGIIYHHSILRMNALIKRIIIELVLYFDEHHQQEDDPIVKTLLDYRFFKKFDDKYLFMAETNIAPYDESWLKTMFRAISASCDAAKSRPGFSERCATIVLLTNTFLKRNVNNLVSVWKSSQDCQSRLGFKLEQFQKLNAAFAVRTNDLGYEEFIKGLEEYFIEKEIVFLAEKVKLPAFAKNPLFINRDRNVGTMDSISLRSLAAMSETMLTVHFFLVGENLKFSDQKEDYINKVVEDFSVYANSIV